jgi:subtilase family serine protease
MAHLVQILGQQGEAFDVIETSTTNTKISLNNETTTTTNTSGPMPQIQCGLLEWLEIDNSFAKLAAKGITVIVASGDAGAGYDESTKKLFPSW